MQLQRYRKVRNIVCFALGTLYPEPSISEGPQRYVSACHKYIVASSIARYLCNLYAKEDPSIYPISILAYDPNYTPEDLALLYSLNLAINMVSDPHHLIAINEHTLVISIFLPQKVQTLEIIADLCYLTGPAGMLCNKVNLKQPL